MAGPTLAPPLAAGEIHLWWIDLDARPPDISPLSPAERARAGRFVFPVHRDRYIAAHGALRAILARYLETDAHSLRFVTAPAGKPAIDVQMHGPQSPAFSLSHSAAHGAVAVACTGAIGVDLEAPKPDRPRRTMLELLAPGERAAAQGLDDEALASAFLVAWTRKEACAKAVGSGLAVRPQQIEAGLNPGPGTVDWDAESAGGTGPRAPDAAGDPLPCAVHVLTLQSPAGIPTSLARVGDPIARVRTFDFLGDAA